jgi:DNA-binding response OmpR family regulator
MKVLACGRAHFMTELTSIFTSYGFEVLEISLKGENPTPDFLEKPDLVLIDEKMKDSIDLIKCTQILRDVPVVLFVKTKGRNWQELEQLKVDGYVKNTYSRGEIIARLFAIHRRVSTINKEFT